MAYIGWPTNVNKTILDSTTVTVGEGATVQDTLEVGGQKKIRLACSNPPDKYEVTMNFSFAEESRDENGLTEIERFFTWYKWTHCYGVNPFIFPAILLNSNRQEGYIGQAYSQNFNYKTVEYYIITSAVQGSKSGTDQQVTMTWETHSTGIIQIPWKGETVERIEAHANKVRVYYSVAPTNDPTLTKYKFTMNDKEVTIQQVWFNGDKVADFYYLTVKDPGTYTVKINIDGIAPSTFKVEK